MNLRRLLLRRPCPSSDWLQLGFPRGIERVLNSEIGFQDLEKVLILAEMYTCQIQPFVSLKFFF